MTTEANRLDGSGARRNAERFDQRAPQRLGEPIRRVDHLLLCELGDPPPGQDASLFARELICLVGPESTRHFGMLLDRGREVSHLVNDVHRARLRIRSKQQRERTTPSPG